MKTHWTAHLHEVGTLRTDGEDIARLDVEIAKLKARRAKMEREALKRARMDWTAEEIAAAKVAAKEEDDTVEWLKGICA
jgi:hypothetical protein